MMKRFAFAVVMCIALGLLVSGLAQSAPDWQIQLRAASGTNSSGNCYIGAYGTPPARSAAPSGSVQLYEARTDGISKVSNDIRERCGNCTYVWSDWYLSSTLARNTVITVSWEPGAGQYALPTGSYSLLNLATGISYDLSGPGSFTVKVGASGVQAEFRIIATIGTGATLSKAIHVTASAIQYAPVVDLDGCVYFGSPDASERIMKVNPNATPPTVSYISAAASGGKVIGRLAYYGSAFYAGTDTDRLIRVPMAGGGWKTAKIYPNPSSTPAVDSAGNIYVGCGETLVKLNNSGSSIATSANLGGLVGSPSVPGANMVWVNVGNRLLCLSTDLRAIRASYDAGAPVGNPATHWAQTLTVAAAGNKLITFDSTSLVPSTEYPIGGSTACPVFIDPQWNAIFTASDHKLYSINLYSGTLNQAVSLPWSGTSTDSPVVVGDYNIVAGGGDGRIYLVSRTSGSVRVVSVNQATHGCVTSADGNGVFFTSEDGNLYIIQ